MGVDPPAQRRHFACQLLDGGHVVSFGRRVTGPVWATADRGLRGMEPCPGRPRSPVPVSAVATRTIELTGALRALDEDGLMASTALVGWSRLTIACHLRYGAEALRRMTLEAIAGHPTAYYPGGRQADRPATLGPAPGESPVEVVDTLIDRSGALQQTWESLTDRDWETPVHEPADKSDLGPLGLGRLPLLRLTEVEVHGERPRLGLEDWSECFVHEALPFRLDRLNTRTVRQVSGRRIEGSWLLVATDGPVRLVTVRGTSVSSVPAAADAPATAVIEGTGRDILSLLLGRRPAVPLTITGDLSFGRAFGVALPGP